MKGRLYQFLIQLRRILLPNGNLMERSLTSGIWTMALNISSRLFQLLTFVVLAQLLTPRAFGILGITMVIITGLRRLSKLGLNEALIYNEQSNVDQYLNTAWTLNCVRGLILSLLLFLATPLIAWVFDEALIVDILRVMAIGPLIFALKNPAIVYFQKDLEFHKQFAYEVSGEITYFMVALIYALVEPTVWALVFGYIGRNLVKTTSSYLLDGYRPWPEFNSALAGELIDYGKWLTASSIANFIGNEGDDLFIGWLLGSSAVGFYQMSYRLSNAPATEVTHVISRVTFPVYSEIQNDVATLRAAFFRTARITAFLAAPMAIGIAVIAPTFVQVVLGEEWLAMVLPMQILAFYGLARGYGASFGSVFRATGNPDYQFKFDAMTIILTAIFIYPASSRFGLPGAALVVTAVRFFPLLPIAMYAAANAVDGSMLRLAKQFAYPLPATGCMGIVVYWARETISSLPAAVELVLLILLGITVYLVAIPLTELRIDWGIIGEIKEIRDTL